MVRICFHAEAWLLNQPGRNSFFEDGLDLTAAHPDLLQKETGDQDSRRDPVRSGAEIKRKYFYVRPSRPLARLEGDGDRFKQNRWHALKTGVRTALFQ